MTISQCQLSHTCLRLLQGNTINGTTYAGWRARTTGAPQQMWFGPSGDPLGAGIHTKEVCSFLRLLDYARAYLLDIR